MKNLNSKIKTIITHNGSFHSDEVFGCAVLSILFPKAKIIRTRDEKIIEKGDIVIDVGGIYNPKKMRFDHHQKGGAGIRKDSIPYASFGLIWKTFGLKLCKDKAIV